MTDGRPEAPDLADALGTLRVAVLGSGLAAAIVARELARPGFEVTLVPTRTTTDATPAATGIASPDAALPPDASTSPAVFTARDGALTSLIDALGLAESVRPERETPQGIVVAAKHGAHGARVVAAPAQGILGIPASPLASDVVAAMGWRGALRAYLDRFRPVLTIGQERNLGKLVLTRMGARVLNGLVAPAARARFGADPDELDTGRALPGLNPALTRLGTLSGAAGELLTADLPPRALLATGVHALVDALVTDAQRRGATLASTCATRLMRLETEGAGDADAAEDSGSPTWSIAIEPRHDGERAADATSERDPEHHPRDGSEHDSGDGNAESRTILADVIVLADDAGMPNLPGGAEPLNGIHDRVRMVSETDVYMTVAARTMDASPHARVLGTTALPGSPLEADDLTARFGYLDGAREGHVLRLRYGGGAPQVEEMCRVASILFGVPIDATEVVEVRVVSCVRPADRAIRDEGEARDALREKLENAGLIVTGEWLAGSDPAEVAEHADRVARRVRTQHWRSLDVRA